MSLLLRGCFLYQQKLFKQEIISLKRLIPHSVYNNNVKEYRRTLQMKQHASCRNDDDNDRKLIYVGELSNKLRILRIFSLTSTTISLCFQPVLYNKLMLEVNIAHVAVLLVFINLLTACTPILIHVLTKPYGIRMYYNLKQQNYIAITYNFFVKETEMVFKAEDAKRNNKPSMFTNCIVKGTPMFFDQDGFMDLKHYHIIVEQMKHEDFEVEELAVHAINQPQVTHKDHHLIENKLQEKQ